MLLAYLLAIPSRNSRNFYPLCLLNLFPCHYLLFLYYSLIFVVSLIMMSTIHMVADKWVHLLMWLSWQYQKIFLILLKRCIAPFILIICLMFDIFHYILVLDKSFIMLVNILLFQHNSHQICSQLFSIFCQHNRLKACYVMLISFKMWTHQRTAGITCAN